jgi:hypothetical protein
MKTIYTTNKLLNAIGTRLNDVNKMIYSIEDDARRTNKDKRSIPGFAELITERSRLSAALKPLINDHY